MATGKRNSINSKERIKSGVNTLKTLWDQKREFALKQRKLPPGPGDYNLPHDNINLSRPTRVSFCRESRIFEKMSLQEFKISSQMAHGQHVKRASKKLLSSEGRD